MVINVSSAIWLGFIALLGFACHVLMKAEEGKRKHKAGFTIREFAKRNWVGWLASAVATPLVMIVAAEQGVLNYMTAALAGYAGNSVLQKMLSRAESLLAKEPPRPSQEG